MHSSRLDKTQVSDVFFAYIKAFISRMPKPNVQDDATSSHRFDRANLLALMLQTSVWAAFSRGYRIPVWVRLNGWF
jgi:hypothetical protein